MTQPTFRGSVNIAMKIPRAHFDSTVAFYRDVLGLEVDDMTRSEIAIGVSRSFACSFGPTTLWLDEVENYSQADLWLEVATDDLTTAMDHLSANGFSSRDELEPLPEGTKAHWIANPAGVVHLVAER